MNRGSSKDAQINLSRGECACVKGGAIVNDAVVKDAQIKLRREECV